MNALGGEFVWTLNHEIVFSTALTGRPKKKLFFSQYCWKRCVVGTTEGYAEATSKQEWEIALIKGDLHGLQSFDNKETIVLCPYNNTEYLNVAAYLEAFWGYIWPTLCHNNVPPHEEWTTNLHGGLKEFIDHAISTLGRTHLKPTTECLRGVATYPTGDLTQRRYKMTLSDLKNEHITKNCIVLSLTDEEKDDLLTRGVLPPESTARDRRCVMCPVRRGSPKLLPCCLCYNWCHPGCSYQTHLGRVCPCHVQILDPKRKIIVLRHPYHEDLVVLPTRPNLRVDSKSIAREASYRSQSGESLTRWSPSLWLNTLLEKHAWLSAGLVWMQGASQSADVGVYNDLPQDAPEPRPTISLFEHWEEGAHLPVTLDARNYSFPSSLVIPFMWIHSPASLSLSDAINNVSLHGEKRVWGQASQINLVPGDVKMTKT